MPDFVTILVPLLGDIDLDGDVDHDDIAIIYAARDTPADSPYDIRDLNGDGVINVLDAQFVGFDFDSDVDGVCDAKDQCPGTGIPEGVPPSVCKASVGH